jgi:hypothetical protein
LADAIDGETGETAPAASADEGKEPADADAVPKPPETYCTQVILNATGSYENISKFMNALYADGRSLTVDNLGINEYQNGEKIAMVSIRIFSAPFLDNVREESYSFPAPAGQAALMPDTTEEVPEATDAQDSQEGE